MFEASRAERPGKKVVKPMKIGMHILLNNVDNILLIMVNIWLFYG